MVLGRGYSFITLFGHRKQSHKARAASQSSYPPFDIYSPLCPASVVTEVHRLQDTFSSRAGPGQGDQRSVRRLLLPGSGHAAQARRAVGGMETVGNSKDSIHRTEQ